MNRIHNSFMVFSDKKWLAEILTLNYADDADFCKPTQPCCHHFEVQCRYDEPVHRRLVCTLYQRIGLVYFLSNSICKCRKQFALIYAMLIQNLD